MDKEKEIEEMAQAQGNYCKNNNRSCKDCAIKYGEECGNYITALILYEAGYRKADEVRKETAKEILQYIFDPDCYGDLSDVCELNGWAFTAAQKDRVFKHFGVEVDDNGGAKG